MRVENWWTRQVWEIGPYVIPGLQEIIHLWHNHRFSVKSLPFRSVSDVKRRPQWPRGLRHRSAAALLLRSWIRIPPAAWMFVCCVLSGRGLCDELITRPEESYRLWCVVVCDLETSRIGAPYVHNISCLRVKRHVFIHPSTPRSQTIYFLQGFRITSSRICPLPYVCY